MTGQFVVGVDLGGTKILTALADSDGQVIAEQKIFTESAKGQEHVITRIVHTVEYVLQAAGVKREQVRALALGAPGPVDAVNGVIRFAPNLAWRDVSICRVLEQHLSLPVFLDNDANLAALGEYVYGAGQGVNHMVYMTVSTGIGGGLILDGKLYHGASGVAGEIGHMTVMPGGPLCGCGKRGCMEALASGTAIAREARELAAGGQGEKILALAGGEIAAITAATVAEAAEAGDLTALDIIKGAASYLGIGLANIITLLNPSRIVLGGGVINIGEPLLNAIIQEVQVHVMEEAGAAAGIVRAKLGGHSGVMGAVALALQANIAA